MDDLLMIPAVLKIFMYYLLSLGGLWIVIGLIGHFYYAWQDDKARDRLLWLKLQNSRKYRI